MSYMRLSMMLLTFATCLFPADRKKAVEIPSEILARIRNDLGLKPDDLRCIHDYEGGVEHVVSADALSIAPKVEALVVHGLPLCLAGNYNAALLLYARRLEGDWQLLITGHAKQWRRWTRTPGR
jgi:hypothetical protein